MDKTIYRVLHHKKAFTNFQWGIIAFVVLAVLVILSFLIMTGSITGGEGGIFAWLDRLRDIL